MEDVKITRNTLRLLSVFVDSPATDFYGLELSELTEVAYGSLLPLLIRLEDASWLAGEWEHIDPVKEGRPKRKYFRLTEDGMMRARELVNEEVAFLSGKLRSVTL